MPDRERHQSWKTTRAINAQPWEPLPGMVKLLCPGCGYFFATFPADPDVSVLCLQCLAALEKAINDVPGEPQP